MVDDRDTHSDSADDVEDHEALRQAVAEDDTSGLDLPGVLLDEEDVEDEDVLMAEDSPPRSKLSPSQGRVRAGALSFSGGGDDGSGSEGEPEESVSSSKPALKPWQASSDKGIYEQQLMLMQEQLSSTMIEKEELKSMLCRQR